VKGASSRWLKFQGGFFLENRQESAAESCPTKELGENDREGSFLVQKRRG